MRYTFADNDTTESLVPVMAIAADDRSLQLTFSTQEYRQGPPADRPLLLPIPSISPPTSP